MNLSNEITIVEPYEYLWRTVKLLGPEARFYFAVRIQ